MFYNYIYIKDSSTTDIETILENIRLNSVIYSKIHRKEYFFLKNQLKYFRIPIIVLSGLNSVFSVGLQPFLNQGLISVLNCVLALTCCLIGSVELYLKINEQMENNFTLTKDYYILSIDILKQLKLLYYVTIVQQMVKHIWMKNLMNILN